jgi:hypothetical protein
MPPAPRKTPRKHAKSGTPTSNPLRVPSRDIPPATACLLWGRSGGRCEFPGCNRLLYRSAVTAQEANIAEKAHIYAFSAGGPRGHRGVTKSTLNSADNLLLVCHDCHVLIDRREGSTLYPPEFLLAKKAEHERRIEIVTGIDPSRKSHVLLYGANIGVHTSPVTFHVTAHAMLPDRYPAEAVPISLGVVNASHTEQDDSFWQFESQHLRRAFETQVGKRVRSQDIDHLSVFALAPQPLLILLGTLLCDITPADVYQRHREPPTWAWPASARTPVIRIQEPGSTSGTPALVLALSATIVAPRITAVLGEKASIWSITVAAPHNDVLRSRQMLGELRTALRHLLNRIKAAHGEASTLHIFPAAPAAVNVELGRVRMPKADTAWTLYDQVGDRGFIQAFTIPRGD